MNADEILAWFKANNPKTLAQITEAGIETAPMPDGGSRRVYSLLFTPWCLKIQRPNVLPSQNFIEAFALTELNENPHAASLVPTLIYQSPTDARMLIETRYDISPAADAQKYFVDVLTSRLVLVSGWRFDDVHAHNIRLDADGNPRLVDLGYARKI